MSVSFDHVKREVHKKIRRSTIEELTRYTMIDPQPSLWSYPIDRSDFIIKTIYVMFYKSLEAVGYGELRGRCKDWYGTHELAQNTFEHNVQAMRASYETWYKGAIVLGTIEEWEDLGREITFNNEKVVVHLLADSTDFRTTGPPGAGGPRSH